MGYEFGNITIARRFSAFVGGIGLGLFLKVSSHMPLVAGSGQVKMYSLTGPDNLKEFFKFAPDIGSERWEMIFIQIRNPYLFHH